MDKSAEVVVVDWQEAFVEGDTEMVCRVVVGVGKEVQVVMRVVGGDMMVFVVVVDKTNLVSFE